MANKREVKDIAEAKKILEKVVTKEKLTRFPVVNGTNQTEKKPTGPA